MQEEVTRGTVTLIVDGAKLRLEAEGHIIISKGRTNIKYFVKDYEKVLFELT